MGRRNRFAFTQPDPIPKIVREPWGDRLLPDDFNIEFQKLDRRCKRDCIWGGVWLDLQEKCVAYGRWSVTGRVVTPTRAAEHLWEVDSHLGWAIMTWCLGHMNGRTQLSRFARNLLASIQKEEHFFERAVNVVKFPVRDEWNIPMGDYHHTARDFLPEGAEYPAHHQDTIKYLDEDNTPAIALWEIFEKDMYWLRDHVTKRFAVAAVCGCGHNRPAIDNIIFRLRECRPISYDEILNFDPEGTK